MTIRTPHPRRRVSSRTKKRCRNIKNFFCRSRSTNSNINNKHHSSIKISISDLKEKISGLETQLDKISKHCYSSTQINNSTDHQTKQTSTDSKATHSNRESQRYLNSNNTGLLYEATSSNYDKTDDSDNTTKRKVKNNIMNNVLEPDNVKKPKRHKAHEIWQHDEEFYRHEKLASRRLANIHNQNSSKEERKRQQKDHQRAIKIGNKNKHSHKEEISQHFQPSSSFNEKNRRNDTTVDQEFISNIIRKQYKPVKIFGAQASNISQFSAPVCRDREFTMRDKICYDYDLCSCCFDQSRRHDYKKINSDVSEMRSVCDARLYSSKKRGRCKHRKGLNDFNNSDYYDLVPVKEKSSPKARKRIEYETIAHNKYNEVPPSPRTLRPRLNLQAKMYDGGDDISQSNECSSTNIHNKNKIRNESDSVTDERFDKTNNLRKGMSTLLFENIDKFSSNENGNQSKQSTDTERSLAEIKDLLQGFLTIINKNSTHDRNNTKSSSNNANNLNGHSDTSNYPANATANVNNNSMSNAFAHCNVPPVMPIFPNNCCYPIMPIYPVNYLQNGHLLPNYSNTCNSCAKTSKHPKRSSSTCDNKHESNTSSETQELIKEIHDFVTRNPITIKRKERSRSKCRHHLVTRSVGDSSIGSNYKNLEHTKRCISKSCEALGCGDSCNIYSNASYSDTVLERFSVEATRSTTEFDPTFETRQVKPNKLMNIFNPWKWRKKKNDAIEEMNESEDLMGDDIHRRAPPFKQTIANYSMYSQEYYNRPPIIHQPQYNPKHSTPLVSPRFTRDDMRHRAPDYFDNQNTPPYHRHHPEGAMPQVPLCLKEIEVKSAGTQSERKMSLFKKFTRKIKVESEPSVKTTPPAKAKSGIFNWKILKETAKTGAIPKDFTFKTQQNLAQGDTKMKNALIKKLFYKRNPFSPRNLIVKTLLGNDPTSFGNPPKLIKPKFFI